MGYEVHYLQNNKDHTHAKCDTVEGAEIAILKFMKDVTQNIYLDGFDVKVEYIESLKDDAMKVAKSAYIYDRDNDEVIETRKIKTARKKITEG